MNDLKKLIRNERRRLLAAAIAGTDHDRMNYAFGRVAEPIFVKFACFGDATYHVEQSTARIMQIYRRLKAANRRMKRKRWYDTKKWVYDNS